MPIAWDANGWYNSSQVTFLGQTFHYTPLKTNMSLENQWLEDVFPTEIVTF